MQPKPVPELTSSDLERFWKYVSITYKTSCWEWTGCLGGNKSQAIRYGAFRLAGKHHKAHRVSWRIYHARSPADRVLHTCDNPKCVNPAHLFEGSPLDNALDRKEKGRGATGDRNGSRTHPENLIRGDLHWTKTNPEKLSRGSMHWYAKLTEEDILDIRSLMAFGAERHSLATAYNVTYENIVAIVARRTWRYL